MLNPLAGLVLLCGVVAIGILHIWKKKHTSNIPLPPGPKALPFIGNVHQLPDEYQQQEFLSWGRKFGESFPQFDTGSDLFLWCY